MCGCITRPPCSPGYVINALVLGASVALFASVIGVAYAWQIERHDFQAARFFGLALLCPWQCRLYVAAYALTDYRSSAALYKAGCGRRLLAEGRLLVSRVCLMPGAIVAFSPDALPSTSTRLYGPRFAERGPSSSKQRAHTGAQPSEAWWRAALPVARRRSPVAHLLVTMETLADFGTVSYYGGRR